MKDVKYLIEDIRLATENTQHSEFIGISDREILTNLNEALQVLQSEIVSLDTEIFVKDYVVTVNGTSKIDLPSDAYLATKVVDVNYRRTATSGWCAVEPTIFDLRPSGRETGAPYNYIRRTGYIELDTSPRSGEIMISYVYKLPSLELQRAKVLSVTLELDNTVSSLLLDLDDDEIGVDYEPLLRSPYVTICDKYGNIKMDKILVDSIDQDTGEIVVHPSFIFEEGQSIESGDYVLSGKRTTNFLPMDDHLERYLRTYCELKITKREGSSEVMANAQLLQNILDDIISVYSRISSDVYKIPIINEDMDEFD